MICAIRLCLTCINPELEGRREPCPAGASPQRRSAPADPGAGPYTLMLIPIRQTAQASLSLGCWRSCASMAWMSGHRVEFPRFKMMSASRWSIQAARGSSPARRSASL